MHSLQGFKRAIANILTGHIHHYVTIRNGTTAPIWVVVSRDGPRVRTTGGSVGASAAGGQLGLSGAVSLAT